MNQNEFVSGGRATRPATISQVQGVYAFTPVPLMVRDVSDIRTHLGGAWTYAHRKGAGMKIRKADERLRFIVKRETIEEACAIWEEKEIAPAAWVAWRLCIGVFTRPRTLEQLIDLPWLRQGAKRGWFRQTTRGMFGGRAILVGDPEGLVPGSLEAMTYAAWAADAAKALDGKMQTAAQFGELFPNVESIAEALKPKKPREPLNEKRGGC